MKQLFSSPNSVEIGLLRNRLEAAGIACEMRNEFLSPAMALRPGALGFERRAVRRGQGPVRRVACPRAVRPRNPLRYELDAELLLERTRRLRLCFILCITDGASLNVTLACIATRHDKQCGI